MVNPGPPQQAMSENRVRSLTDIHPKLDAILGGSLGELRNNLVGTFGATKLFGINLAYWSGGVSRSGGVELIGAVDDLDGLCDGIWTSCRLLQGRLESTLSDETPWTHHVGPDFNLHVCTLDGQRAIIGRSVGHVERNLLLERLDGLPFEDVQASFCAVIVDGWISQGVRHAMIAPGSRSTPLALAIVARTEIHVEVFHDERSAAFAALGVGLATGQPAVLLCTSGTAAAHFHAAVIESSLSHVPLLVVTADRPPELKDVGAPQTIDQTKLYGDAVRWFHDPGVADIAASGSWHSLARQSYASTVGVNSGPVHLNLPFREPLAGKAIELSSDQPIRAQILGSIGLSDSEIQQAVALLENRKGIIIAGRGCGDASAISELAVSLGWPVLADSRSGCQGIPESVVHFDSLIRSQAFVEQQVLEVVLRIGESPSSKVLNQYVTKSRAFQVHVSAFENTFDADSQVSMHISCDPTTFCRGISRLIKAASDPNHLSQWVSADQKARAIIAKEFASSKNALSAPQVAFVSRASLSTGDNLFVSSSMPVRDLEWFGGDCSLLHVFSNRGANGIDGVIASAIGVAIATRQKTLVLLGDVAFLHDSSSLTALADRDVDLKIVVTDNDGGGIFHYLPQAEIVSEQVFEKLFGTPHQTDLVRLAQAHRLATFDCDSVEQLQKSLSTAGSCVIRVRTDRVSEVAIHQQLHELVSSAIQA
jgi:2-succinyl-5-enolpyruvyl-6-hydroxy-3-cyclohexene-1-carboxylate synthase